jgi:hypothetical protein
LYQKCLKDIERLKRSGAKGQVDGEVVSLDIRPPSISRDGLKKKLTVFVEWVVTAPGKGLWAEVVETLNHGILYREYRGGGHFVRKEVLMQISQD